MAVIQLEIDETLIRSVGTEAVKRFVERQLSLLRLEHLGKTVARAIQHSDVDHHAEVQGAREEAWQEMKVFRDVAARRG
jgi:hypothetical protein